MDNLGAIVGPLLALALVAARRRARGRSLLSVIPGLLAAAAIVYAIRRTPRPERRDRQPLRIRVRPVLRGELGRLLAAVAAFEVGNVAATLLILRATELLTPADGAHPGGQVALLLYTGYNLAATLASFPAGRLADRLGPRGPVRVLAAGVALFAVGLPRLRRRPARPARCSRCRSSPPVSPSAASRPPNTPPSPPSPPPTCAAPPSACSPPSRPPATSPPAPSPACSGQRDPPRRFRLPHRLDAARPRRSAHPRSLHLATGRRRASARTFRGGLAGPPAQQSTQQSCGRGPGRTRLRSAGSHRAARRGRRAGRPAQYRPRSAPRPSRRV